MKLQVTMIFTNGVSETFLANSIYTDGGTFWATCCDGTYPGAVGLRPDARIVIVPVPAPPEEEKE